MSCVTNCATATERPCVLVAYDGPLILDWRANLQPDETVGSVTVTEIGSSELDLTGAGPNTARYLYQGEEIPVAKAAVVNVANPGATPGTYRLRFKITTVGTFSSTAEYDVLLEMI